MNIIEAFQALRQSHIYNRRLKQAANRLATQLSWQIDPEMPVEELTIELLAYVSRTIAIASFIPQAPKLTPNLDDLNLTKRPLKQAQAKPEPQSQPLLTPEYLAIKTNDLN